MPGPAMKVRCDEAVRGALMVDAQVVHLGREEGLRVARAPFAAGPAGYTGMAMAVWTLRDLQPSVLALPCPATRTFRRSD